MSNKTLAFLLTCCYLPLALAKPAPWFIWRSKVNGESYCAQISPGANWIKSTGPYKNPHCEKEKPLPPPAKRIL